MIRRKEFITATFDPKDEIFIVHVAAYISSSSDVNHICPAGIIFFKGDKIPTVVCSKYANFVDVFSPNLAAKLSWHTEINDCIIASIDGK